ncbi:uncharacterized protein [Drosophila kikkawai]|uniref:Uncharacterized protein n=1 Tax=Drosophila kikkawai TaxID=30033 RepID=A0A6P4JGA3_DROKI|nr:uncharacterized protein LOC108082651 [Drosophila kikkawai]KAH8330123.1 hypothetical protein KR059_009966 [Drosophila kikkawai]
MLETISEFYRTSLIFWSNLIAILLQFVNITCGRHTSQDHNKPQAEDDNLQFYNMISKTMESFVEEELQRVQRKVQMHAQVDLLHRLLVQQQLQELERRRLMRLAVARRRLEYSN